jgi:membrane protein
MSNSSEHKTDDRNDKPPLWAFALAAIALVFDPSARLQTHRVAEGEDRDSVPVRNDRSRGRAASIPSDIPAKGWKDIFWRAYHNVSKHRLVAIAAGVTFYALLAIFPGIAALVAIYGLIAAPSTINQHVKDLSGVLPGGATEVIGDQLQRLTSQPPGKLGFALLFGVVISLWSINAGMKALFDALNVVHGVEEKRSFLRLNMVSFAFTLSSLLFMVFALAAIAVLPNLMNHLGLSNATGWLTSVGKWPILLVGVALAIALIYRYGPS